MCPDVPPPPQVTTSLASPAVVVPVRHSLRPIRSIMDQPEIDSAMEEAETDSSFGEKESAIEIVFVPQGRVTFQQRREV